MMQCQPSTWLHRCKSTSAISQWRNLWTKRAPFAVVDLELIRMPELKQVCAQFPATAIVCIHRLADDALWSEALAMGAVDCCYAGDLQGILLAAERYVVLSRAHSTAA